MRGTEDRTEKRSKRRVISSSGSRRETVLSKGMREEQAEKGG